MLLQFVYTAERGGINQALVNGFKDSGEEKIELIVVDTHDTVLGNMLSAVNHADCVVLIIDDIKSDVELEGVLSYVEKRGLPKLVLPIEQLHTIVPLGEKEIDYGPVVLKEWLARHKPRSVAILGQVGEEACNSARSAFEALFSWIWT